jgi:3-hydroxymyristoyl/3-hydroxydecanoyl-(acyl carrier protein) dehydratase
MAPSQKINIPQKPPMVMVDRIISSEDTTTITSFVIREDNVFIQDGLLREPGLIENIAQSAAAAVSSKPVNADEKPKLGFIGAIRDLRIHGFPKTGDEIETKVTVTHEIFNATVVSGEIRLNDQLIAECELRIFMENS